MTKGTWGYYLKRSLAKTSLLKATAMGWWEDKAPRLGAALAFYTVLSLAPMLVLAIPLIGAVFGEETARKQIAAQFTQLAGPEGGAAIEQMLKSTAEVAEDVAEAGADTQPATQPDTQPATQPATGPSTQAAVAAPVTQAAATQPATAPTTQAAVDVLPKRPGALATGLSVIVLLFAASGVFAELQDSLNTIWEVTPKPGKAAVWDFIRQRFLSFAMVMGICFLLLVSLLLTAALEALRNYAWGPLEEMAFVWQVLHQTVSFGVITLLFAMIFKILPDATVGWRDVWLGAVITSALFTVGRLLIGKYLGTFGVGARYGAAGSLVALLVWVYYSAQILLMGAEFTKAYSMRNDSDIRPTAVAVPMTEDARAQQGIPHKEVVQAVAQVVEQHKVEDAVAAADAKLNVKKGGPGTGDRA
jgi:membrane protein